MANKNFKFLEIPIHTRNITFNPTLAQDFSSLWISRQINCQIFRNNSGEIENEVAKSIKFISPTHLNIKLYSNFTFNNGQILTADDVIASLFFLKEKRTILRNSLEWIEDIKKINNFEIEIILKKPYPQFLHVFSAPNYSIFPMKFINKVKKDPSLWNKPLTCGPYYVSNINKKSLTILPRKQGMPVRFYYQPSGVINANQAKNFDIILLEIKDPENIGSEFSSVKIFDPFQFLYIPNTHLPPWNNRNARCALLSKINPTNVMTAYGKLVKPAADLIPSGTFGYSSEPNFQHAIYEEGKALTKPKKNNFCFSYIESSIEENIREQFQKMFLKLYPSTHQISLQNGENMADDFQKTHCDGMILVLKSNYLDAYEYLLIFSERATNISGYTNLKLANKINNSQKIVSPSTRAGEYRSAIEQIRKECLAYPLFTMPYETIYVKKNINPVNIGVNALNEYLLTNVIKND